MKRFLDIFLSSLALVALSPFLFVVSIILRFTGEGEIFYKQERVGRYGDNFYVLKFATMLKDSPKLGAGEITLENDPRVLPFGNFLRKSKINEFPQLWNIIYGDMSIVGPRPMVPNTYYKYDVNDRIIISKVRPGLTGIGSIFFRNEERFLKEHKNPNKFYEQHIIPYKSKLEIWFVENNSLITYLKSIIVTAWIVLFPSSNIRSFFFKNLPKVPKELQ
tara:strand:+ start:89 stop:745 length:657 start_codon:yes stop_codon:yes gene_type:complete